MAATDLLQKRSGSPAQPLSFRIFLASPGDVTDERELARRVIEQMRGERAFRGRLNLEPIAWDQPGAAVAMEAALTPQAAIARGLPKPSQCDLVLVILWARIGTPLPEDHVKPDGSRYLSGTEWEFHDAVTAFRGQGRPSVWLYRRTQAPSPSFDDPDYGEKREQWQRLNTFLASLNNADGSIAGGINPYATPDDFRQTFEQHLRDRLTAELEQLNGEAVETTVQPLNEPPRWQGAPYPGLEAFTSEQSPIFFGRGRETDELLQVLRDGARFVAVVGASGSGKSSLVAAGLIPRLRAGALEGSAHWRELICKPGERGGDPFLALAYALKAALGTSGRREKDLAAELRVESGKLDEYARELLAAHPAGAELLLVVDQFEELFTQVAPDVCRTFLEFLQHMVSAPGRRVIVTLRADFYGRALEFAELAELLRRPGGTFPLAAPGVGALHEMITGPARAAGLELEEGLVAAVQDDTGTAPGALSLMAFALHELWRRGGKDDCLSLADYRAIGGVTGALRQRAEAALKPFEKAQDKPWQTLLNRVFAEVVEVDEQGVATRRRAALNEFRRDTPTGELVDALVDARLLVTGKGEADEPTVEVAHEALLTAWPRLREWIEKNAAALRARRDLERAAREWEEAGRPKWRGLPSGGIVKRYRSAPTLSERARDYLRACRRLLWVRGSVAVLALSIVGGFFWWANAVNLSPGAATRVLLIRWGPLASPPEPSMVLIPVGSFLMGSPKTDPDAQPDEFPQHEVVIEEAFWMGEYEVTFAEYDAYVQATGRRTPRDSGWGRDRRPVIDVSWDDAVAYAEWLSLVTGRKYRLPSEAEWEYAARAGTTTRYWWGNEMKPNMANCGGCESTWEGKDKGKETAPVGSFPENPFGLYDTAGNVWEWTCSVYEENYEGAEQKCVSKDHADPRVLRGGSWDYGPHGVRAANRDRDAPATRYGDGGFRLARQF